MSQSKRLSLVTIAALLAIGFAVYEWYEAALVRAAERGLRARWSEQDARLRAAEEDLHAAERRAALAVVPAAPAAAPTPAPGATPFKSRNAWIASHPDVRTRYLKDFRSTLDATYGPVFKTLNLSAEQIERVKDLLTQREDKNITVAQNADSGGLDPAAVVELGNQLTRANNAAIKAVVGDDDYQAIHQYLRETAVVPLVSTLSSTMAGLNQPLTADQEMKLTAVLSASSQRRNDNTAVVANTVNWDQAVAGAQTILSPDQLNAFVLIQQQNQGGQQLAALQRQLVAPPK
jgi:hypothetical protein